MRVRTGRFIATKSLQDFGQDHPSDCRTIVIQQRIDSDPFGGLISVEETYPDTSVDQN
jgi:hypothetical protein